ncbi:hypothetical protein HU200_000555 [Digitaria exilis]|uniref:Fe2OG dioxygenase domain-containing protein n=1 Tax=Digitaria exilis TaxID=1010633 RepID=A0A835FYQ0_9POAL|nr:hypothetical protein HU200_000555 [Digitaria exilis]
MAEGAPVKVIARDKITDATAALFTGSVEVPERFIRADEVEAAGAVVGEDETFEMPVVDMASLLDPELSATETAKLGSACREWAAMQQMKDSAAQFFSLPLETKNTVAVRGDSIQGFGHHFSGATSDKLDWAECLLLFTHRRLLGFMAADLGVSEEALQGAFFSGDGDDAVKGQSMSMHHYPPCRRHRHKVVGIPPHTDSPALTLLLQVDDTPGLQIRRGGRWFPVRPTPGCLVVNVGDILDVLTNGEYGSVQHRVVPDAERHRWVQKPQNLVSINRRHFGAVRGILLVDASVNVKFEEGATFVFGSWLCIANHDGKLQRELRDEAVASAPPPAQITPRGSRKTPNFDTISGSYPTRRSTWRQKPSSTRTNDDSGLSLLGGLRIISSIRQSTSVMTVTSVIQEARPRSTLRLVGSVAMVLFLSGQGSFFDKNPDYGNQQGSFFDTNPDYDDQPSSFSTKNSDSARLHQRIVHESS